MICSVYTKRSSAKSSQRSFLPDVSAPIPTQSSARCRSFPSSAPPNGVPSPTSLPRRPSALWLKRTVLALQRLAPGSRRAQNASVLQCFAQLPGPVDILFAGWLAVRREVDSGEPFADAYHVGWAIVDRLRALGAYGDTLCTAVPDPFDLICLHLRGSARADALEARHFMWRARLRPVRRRMWAARWRSPDVEQT